MIKKQLLITATLMIAVAATLVLGWRTLPGFLAQLNTACISTTLHTQTSAGIHFSVIDTNCDTLAKDENVRVFAWTKDETNKTMIFRFDPIYQEEVPTISVGEDGKINLSIDRVAQVIEEATQFEGRQVVIHVHQSNSH